MAGKVVVNYFMVMERLFRANGEGTTMQLLDLFAGLLWLSSVIFLLFVLDVIITRYLYRK
ncbi:TPA: hypothetical protein ACPUMH_004739 [Klebsiella pneumoniae]|uniref:EscU/YscU/HrcU family type III secretion system export apparatus switch protein n=2 Tax=Klebsiella pneumoniae TaxID=573 RepID=A0A5C2LLY4_KLEPN|nr:hypothetical protein [Klebsiella pneumoniae]MCS6059322.1 hypothetical protein [Klebsiella pneumoniae subsp. pneumoniae]HDT5553750.1 hypothetical protein [Klebsiella pneumoniae subsp. ozaenae]MBZ1751826.1 hypothetical protein [Klebsiella pneumoniae]MCF1653901.1 hypothetical protein [Klebsiella pneumoniae]MDQ6190932.1 hypothetical protein [Klebsiella pneumoniae]